MGVGHYEQPGFLTPKLYGFWVLPVLDGEGTEREMPASTNLGSTGLLSRCAIGWTPTNSRICSWTVEPFCKHRMKARINPSVWVCVLNAALETQVESTLTALAMLLERQQMTRDFAKGDLRALPKEAERIDAETTKLVGEEIRNNGWRSACHAIRARAASSGVSLHVEYKTPMMSVSEIRTRMPMARHIYNTLPGVRATSTRRSMC